MTSSRAFVTVVASAALCLATACQFVVEPAPAPQPTPDESGATLQATMQPNATAETPPDAGLPRPTESAPRVASIAVGGAHVCALSVDGDVACWGRNDAGQLGYAHPWNIGDDEPPTDAGVVDVGGHVVALAAGERHTCALLDTNRIRCWGFGGDLALGNGNAHPETVGDDETPAEAGDAIVYGSTAFQSLTAGDHHTCMLDANGSVKCWGDSPEGALGYGYATKTGGWLGWVPLGTSAPVVHLAAGCEHTCALLEGGDVRCWGHAASIGHGGADNIGDDEPASKVDVLTFDAPVVELAAGHRHTCALSVEGKVRCWGMGGYGALGGGETRSAPSAEDAAVVDLGGHAVGIAAGRRHTCALLEGGTVRCWGDGAHGALGYGNTERVGDDEAVATAGVVQLGEPAVQVGAGDGFSCALLESGTVRCWGAGTHGRLGIGAQEDVGDDELPTAIAPVSVFLP